MTESMGRNMQTIAKKYQDSKQELPFKARFQLPKDLSLLFQCHLTHDMAFLEVIIGPHHSNHPLILQVSQYSKHIQTIVYFAEVAEDLVLDMLMSSAMGPQ